MNQFDSNLDSESLPALLEHPRSERGFWALIATQFQGAYSDNILRNLLLSMIVGMGLAEERARDASSPWSRFSSRCRS